MCILIRVSSSMSSNISLHFAPHIPELVFLEIVVCCNLYALSETCAKLISVSVQQMYLLHDLHETLLASMAVLPWYPYIGNFTTLLDAVLQLCGMGSSRPLPVLNPSSLCSRAHHLIFCRLWQPGVFQFAVYHLSNSLQLVYSYASRRRFEVTLITVLTLHPVCNNQCKTGQNAFVLECNFVCKIIKIRMNWLVVKAHCISKTATRIETQRR